MAKVEHSAESATSKIVRRLEDRAVQYRLNVSVRRWETAGTVLGEALHTIEHGFSPAHVERYDDGSVRRYQNYADQDHHAHDQADYATTIAGHGGVGGAVGATRAARMFIDMVCCKKQGAADIRNWVETDAFRHGTPAYANGAAPGYQKLPERP